MGMWECRVSEALHFVSIIMEIILIPPLAG